MDVFRSNLKEVRAKAGQIPPPHPTPAGVSRADILKPNQSSLWSCVGQVCCARGAVVVISLVKVRDRGRWLLWSLLVKHLNQPSKGSRNTSGEEVFFLLCCERCGSHIRPLLPSKATWSACPLQVTAQTAATRGPICAAASRDAFQF